MACTDDTRIDILSCYTYLGFQPYGFASPNPKPTSPLPGDLGSSLTERPKYEPFKPGLRISLHRKTTSPLPYHHHHMVIECPSDLNCYDYHLMQMAVLKSYDSPVMAIGKAVADENIMS